MFNSPNFGLALRRNYKRCVCCILIASRGDQARFVESANLAYGKLARWRWELSGAVLTKQSVCHIHAQHSSHAHVAEDLYPLLAPLSR